MPRSTRLRVLNQTPRLNASFLAIAIVLTDRESPNFSSTHSTSTHANTHFQHDKDKNLSKHQDKEKMFNL
jgi:hypothetical protein